MSCLFNDDMQKSIIFFRWFILFHTKKRWYKFTKTQNLGMTWPFFKVSYIHFKQKKRDIREIDRLKRTAEGKQKLRSLMFVRRYVFVKTERP